MKTEPAYARGSDRIVQDSIVPPPVPADSPPDEEGSLSLPCNRWQLCCRSIRGDRMRCPRIERQAAIHLEFPVVLLPDKAVHSEPDIKAEIVSNRQRRTVGSLRI